MTKTDSLEYAYGLLDDLLWSFYYSETRVEVQQKYKDLTDLNHTAFSEIKKGNTQKSMGIMNDVISKFNALQEEHGTQQN